VLALETELRMQPWLQTAVESEDWATEIKATYPCIQTKNLNWTPAAEISPTQNVSNPVRSLHIHN